MGEKDDDPKPKTFTQDELDGIVQDRVAKAQAAERKKFADYDELKAFKAKADADGDASKSEVAKLTDQVAALSKDLADERVKSVRTEVAAAKGLTARQVSMLKGDTLDELTSAADEAIADGTFTPKTAANGDGKPDEGKPAGPAGKPVETLAGGTDPTVEPEETNPRKLAEQVPRS